MNEINTVLKILTKLSGNIRFRDRSVKVIQYGCQMLLGYYGKKMSQENIAILKLTRRTASTSRKAFWLLKSVSHLESSLVIISHMKVIDISMESFLLLLDLLEQLSLIVYFAYENLVYLVRNNLVTFSEESIDDVGNFSWIVSDASGFIASIIRFCKLCLKYHNQVNSSYKVTSLEVWRGGLALTTSFLEFGVSAEYLHIWKALLGKDLGDGPVGFFGVASSALIMYQLYEDVREQCKFEKV